MIGKDDVSEAQKKVESATLSLDRAVIHETFLIEKRKEQNKKLQNALAFISTLDFRSTHADIRNRRLGQTGKWILSNPGFLTWLDGTTQSIWCPGLRESMSLISARNTLPNISTAGAGKTFTL